MVFYKNQLLGWTLYIRFFGTLSNTSYEMSGLFNWLPTFLDERDGDGKWWWVIHWLNVTYLSENWTGIWPSRTYYKEDDMLFYLYINF
jgi:hypothetical protein